MKASVLVSMLHDNIEAFGDFPVFVQTADGELPLPVAGISTVDRKFIICDDETMEAF